MTSSKEHSAPPRVGSFDVVDWPERLKARVVEGGDDPAIHGYAVESDLSLHHGFIATLYLALLGELPEVRIARALDVVLTFLTPVPINEAPSHAASLTRLCAAPARTVLAVSAMALAERAHFIVQRNGAFLEWLSSPSGAPPAEACSDRASDAHQRARLRAALPAELELPVLSQPLTREAAICAVLFACGFQRAEHLEAIWTIAGVAVSFAEGMATPAKAFLEYPMNLPAFRYEEAR